MRKLAVVLALASTALATPAFAHDKAWYVGVEGGAQVVEDINYTITSATTGVRTVRASTADHHYGWAADGNVGYDFGGFRLETEVGYQQARLSSYSSTVRVPFYNANGVLSAPGAGAAAGTYNGAGGRDSALSFMLNGLLDFGDDSALQGFVGGGVGAARVKSRYALNQYGSFLNDSDTVFAYQAIAGVRAPLTPHIDATIKYRFFNAGDVKTNAVTTSLYEGRFRSHSILGGVTYNFFTPPPPPAPAVVPPPPQLPPPPPPEQPKVVCAPGPFIVFFEWNKSDITPEAGSILDNAVAQYANCGNAQVMLAGFTDTSGTPKYNIGLSQRRADAVKAYMAAHSIPDGVVTTQAFGEDPAHLRVHTADGVREVQNRRVEITYGPGSGQ